MPDWSLIESTLGTWVQDITGLDVFWRKRPRAVPFSNVGYALLSHNAVVSKGQQDDLDFDYDVARTLGEEIQYYQSGQRTFTLSVQIRTQRTSVDNDARTYTTQLRDAIRLPQRSLAKFQAAEIAFNQILSEVDVDQTLDGRDLSIAQLDIRFNAHASTEDTPIGYIETVDDAELQIPVGNTVWTGDIDL